MALLLPIFLISYLLGAVPFGYLVAHWRGVDILKAGSGNIGATNVGRVLGRRWGILVFVLDLAKGALPVLAALQAPLWSGLDVSPEAAGVTAGSAAFLGHLFPIYLHLRGGRGVATGAGVVLVLLPGPTLAGLAAWLVVVASTRYVSLASLTGAAVILGLRLMRGPAVWTEPALYVTLFCLVAVTFVFVRHAANMGRLLRGEENRLKDTVAMFTLAKTLHVLAVGLWFGSVAFFTFVVALSLFDTFDKVSREEPRPIWFPLAPEFAGKPPSPRFPDPLRKEQGSRAAGAAVGPIFPVYFALQAACAAVAAVTSLSWRSFGRVHRVRAAIFVAALVTVGLGWWLETVVSDLRIPRNNATDAVLRAGTPSETQVREAEAARQEFGQWHLYSLLADFATLLLVTAGMGFAAALPASGGRESPGGSSSPGDSRPPLA